MRQISDISTTPERTTLLPAVLMLKFSLSLADSDFSALPMIGSFGSDMTHQQVDPKKALALRWFAILPQQVHELFACALARNQILDPFIVGVVLRTWIV